MKRAIVCLSSTAFAAYVIFSAGAAQAEAPAAPADSGRRPAIAYALTSEKISDVQIIEEAPGRFIAVIKLTQAQKKVLSELTAAHVGEDLEVMIAGEPVLHTEIRGAMEEISLGPWMNEGLAKLFAKCLTKCGPKKCL